MESVKAAEDWIVSLEPNIKALFLASLAHALTLVGRGSYEVQTQGLTNPEHLRQINEIQHRVMACLKEVLIGENNLSFERSVAHWVLVQADTSLQEQTTWAWQEAKHSISKKAT